MANIVLCRIDSRLIHGQVVTKWVGQSQANRIAVVSDELDADPFMKNIYLMAAPPNIKVDCFSNQSFRGRVEREPAGRRQRAGAVPVAGGDSGSGAAGL